VEARAQSAPSGGRRGAIVAAAALVAAAIAIFAPVLYYMALHWQQVADYSHGVLIAPLAIYFAWERRRLLARAPIEASWWGVVPLALGALALALGRLGVELMSMRTGFVLTLHGIVLLVLGRQIYRVLLFPLLFLFLMVPLPQSLSNLITFPLQLIATDLAVQSLYLLDIPALREGNIIHLANQPLMVAEACSGLRSVMALGTLGIVFAYFFRKTTAERVLIIASTLPIAILVNAFRVGLTGYATHHFGPEVAEGWIHTTEGFFTFLLAFGLLMLEAVLVSQLNTWRRRRAVAT
jgi:exosortase